MDQMPGIDDLVEAAQSGDEAAESQLFSLLRARILPLVQRRIWNTQKPSPELSKDAEDLTTDICVVILREYKTASFYRGFMPWAMQIVRNRIGQYYRERKRWKDKHDPMPDENDMADSTVGPEGEFEVGELDAIISRALEKMGRPCAEIITALITGEIKIYIKQHSEIPVGTIYNQIHRCREKLKALLRKKGYKI